MKSTLIKDTTKSERIEVGRGRRLREFGNGSDGVFQGLY